jgi:hypothetical protein
MPLIAVKRSSVAGSHILLWFAFVLACSPAFAAQPAGEVVYAHGLTSVQRLGEEPRFVAKGDVLSEGDIISTSNRGFAVIGLKDGTKMTLRPDTTFAIEKFSHGAGEESAFLRLVKGGLRALTGLVGKRNPQGMRVSTATATIGIRGTSFDARLCEADCAKEIKTAKKVAVSPAESIVARVALVSGSASVIAPSGQARAVSKGTPLFNGETVRTDKGAYVVLAFRDQSKVTVISESEFKLEDVRFSGQKAESGSFVVRVVRGGVRALTGFLGKRDPSTVRFNVLTATIGIRGTGADTRLALDCVASACAEAAFVYTWEGAVAIQAGQRSLVVGLDHAGVYNPAQDRLVLLDRVPQFFLDETAPRPDKVDVDFDNLFGTQSVDSSQPGLYVSMRDGHVELIGPGGTIDLGPGEAGYLGDGMTNPVRLTLTPPFLLNDPYPLPENFDERTIRLLDVLNPGGGPGSSICEL